MQEYDVSFTVVGRYVVTVLADSLEDAKEVATRKFELADFADLLDADGAISSIEDSNGAYLF